MDVQLWLGTHACHSAEVIWKGTGLVRRDQCRECYCAADLFREHLAYTHAQEG